MTVAPDARIDDGRFDVSVFRGFSKWELIRHLFAIALGRRRYSPARLDLSVGVGPGHEREPAAGPCRRHGPRHDPGHVPDAGPERSRWSPRVVSRPRGGSSGATSGRRRM